MKVNVHRGEKGWGEEEMQEKKTRFLQIRRVGDGEKLAMKIENNKPIS